MDYDYNHGFAFVHDLKEITDDSTRMKRLETDVQKYVNASDVLEFPVLDEKKQVTIGWNSSWAHDTSNPLYSRLEGMRRMCFSKLDGNTYSCY